MRKNISIKGYQEFLQDAWAVPGINRQEYVCLSTENESFIYHITPDALKFKPFMNIDTRVRVFEVQDNRMICDEKVFTII